MTRFALPFIFLIISQVKVFSQSPAVMIRSVATFLSTLSAEEVKKAKFDFQDSNRRKWTNLPVGLVPRSGIRYGDLSDQSRIAFHHVLTTLLTSQGYLKTTSIMQLDDILNTLYAQANEKGEISAEDYKMIKGLKWEHGNYFIAIWGTPGEKESWGLSLGGHHIALSFTQIEGKISVTPLFVGTDPSEIKTAKYAGWRVLSKEEDYGFFLVNGLSESQRAKAVLKQAVPSDIITNPKSSQRITSYYGIPAGELNDGQREMLQVLIEEYVHNFEHEVAHRILSQIQKSGFDQIYFAWVGSLERNQPHYYIINGPDILIEYDNVGFKKDGNHIHAIFREKGNDFGEDILKQHYLNSDHHR